MEIIIPGVQQVTPEMRAGIVSQCSHETSERREREVPSIMRAHTVTRASITILGSREYNEKSSVCGKDKYRRPTTFGENAPYLTLIL